MIWARWFCLQERHTISDLLDLKSAGLWLSDGVGGDTIVGLDVGVGQYEDCALFAALGVDHFGQLGLTGSARADGAGHLRDGLVALVPGEVDHRRVGLGIAGQYRSAVEDVFASHLTLGTIWRPLISVNVNHWTLLIISAADIRLYTAFNVLWTALSSTDWPLERFPHEPNGRLYCRLHSRSEAFTTSPPMQYSF